MANIPDSVRKLVDISKAASQTAAPASEAEVIVVDEVAAKVASFYERIRGIVDWREEHVLRKTAIERILKRRQLLDQGLLVGDEGFLTAEQFLKELIRGGHFPNKKIPVIKVETVRQIINKYVFLLERAVFQNHKEKQQYRDWFLPLVSYEVEIALDPHAREIALIMFMTEDFISRVKLRDEMTNGLSQNEIKLQIYIAAHRALFKMDDSAISSHLFERIYEDWYHPSETTLNHAADHLKEIKELIVRMLNHPLGESFYRVAERYDTPYLLLGDIIAEDPDSFEARVSDPNKLELEIEKAYKNRLTRLRGKMRRAAFYSTVSIFLTKVLMVLALEVPVDRYLQGTFNYSAMAISVFVPPILMAFLITSPKITSPENLKQVKFEVKGLLGEAEKGFYYVGWPRKQGFLARVFLKIFYLASFLVSFGLVSWWLWRLSFGPFSIFIFLFFVSLVAFAGTIIQQRGRELMIGEIRTGFFSGLLDFFFLPFVEFGRWLSRQLIRYNAIIFFFNLLIETPIQIFVEFLEQWRIFLREKKEEIH